MAATCITAASGKTASAFSIAGAEAGVSRVRASVTFKHGWRRSFRVLSWECPVFRRSPPPPPPPAPPPPPPLEIRQRRGDGGGRFHRQQQHTLGCEVSLREGCAAGQRERLERCWSCRSSLSDGVVGGAVRRSRRRLWLSSPSSRNAMVTRQTPTSQGRLEGRSSSDGGEDKEEEEKEEDAMYTRRCVELALKALGHTSPNPVVGCVIVKDGQIVGEGFHPKAGEPHAEVFALRQAGEKAVNGTAYVSLEPCDHYGRTPPCSQALVKARVKRVVIGTLDSNPLVSGKGVQTLRDAGIEVQVLTGVEQELCQRVNEAFFHRIKFRKPFCTLRYSMSLDGKRISPVMKVGTTTTTPTSPPSSCSPLPPPQRGSYYSQLLQATDAVVISASALPLDPLLLTAENGAKQPLRVVLLLDRLEIDGQDFAVFDTKKAPTLVVTTERALVADTMKALREGRRSMETKFLEKGVELIVLPEDDALTLDKVLDILYNRGACSVLWDCYGGGETAPPIRSEEHGEPPDTDLLVRVLQEKEVQKVAVVIVPVISGGEGGGVLPGGVHFSLPVENMKLERCVTSRCGDHIIIEGYLPNTE